MKSLLLTDTKKLSWLAMILGIFVLLTFLISLLIISICSSGKPKPFLNKENKILQNSISEKGFFNINGVKLYYFIKGRNIDNPILLYLHGGMPDYFLTEKYPTNLDDIFTVVWLDQRGAGLSNRAEFPDNSKVLETLISDIKEITLLLEDRFSQEKIYIMGHSGGTFLGIKVIEKYPELYKAYIGVAQISFQKRSEMLAYDFIKNQYANNTQRKDFYAILTKYPVLIDQPLPKEYIKIRDNAMHDLGIGTMHSMKNVITGLFIPSLMFTEYTLSDKINLWKGKSNSGISILWNEIINHDLSIESINFDIPIYFLHGIHDYTCSYDLSREYFEKINAPRKAFFSFKYSAHSPIFEEPNECIRILKNDIIEKTF